MEVGMQIVAYITIFLDESERFVIDHKFLFEAITTRSLVVSIGNIADGDTLGTILCTDPVSIGQIDANGSRGIFVTTQHSCTDDISGNTFDYRLAETGINRRMVFKPLCIATDGLCTLSSLRVDIFYQSFPGTFQSYGIAIHLYKTVDKIDGAIMFL